MSITKKRILVYIVMGLSLIMATKLLKDIYKLWHADERLIEAEEELRAAKQEQEKLKAEIRKTESGEWREEQIRNVLKMAKPNEQIVIVPEEVTRQKKEGSRFAEASRDEDFSNLQKWWQLFMY